MPEGLEQTSRLEIGIATLFIFAIQREVRDSCAKGDMSVRCFNTNVVGT